MNYLKENLTPYYGIPEASVKTMRFGVRGPALRQFSVDSYPGAV